jgi:hypothetical protein
MSKTPMHPTRFSVLEDRILDVLEEAGAEQDLDCALGVLQSAIAKWLTGFVEDDRHDIVRQIETGLPGILNHADLLT